MLCSIRSSGLLRLKELGVGLPALHGLRVRRLGLRGKVLAMYVGSGLIILLVTALLYARTLEDSVRQQYNEHALSIWRVLDATYPSTEELRGPLVQERIVRLKEMNPDVHEMRLYAPVDNRFLLVASSNFVNLGQPATIDDLQPLLQDRPIWREFSDQGEAMAEMGAPLHAAGRPSGVLAVHFSLAPRDALIQRQLAIFFIIAGLGGIVLLAALYWELERLMLKPLLLLQRQSAAIALGNLGHKTDIRRNDEVGQLAVGLDHMAEALEQREEENLRLQQELRGRYEEAELRAVRDPVTDLYNHGHFYERLGQEIARARRLGQPMSLLFCDLDRFKAVNDAHGHQIGDQVLKAVGSVLRSAVREIDVPARYGGEEFAIILPHTDVAGALHVAERIRFRVGATMLPLLPGLGAAAGDVESPCQCEGEACESQSQCCGGPDAGIAVTLSIGVAAYPDDASAEADLVRCADLAMYHSKRLGRNQVHTYQEIRELLVRQDSATVLERDAAYFEAVHSLAAAVDARDRYTHRHSDSVGRYATALARAMGLQGAILTHIHVAGLLHDVGKIGIPDHILGKTGTLTEEEWVKMREHPVVGKTIVQHLSAHEEVVPLILHHHERWDGAGYPHGLVGEDIPVGARIIAVADAYHAMTSDRPYRVAFSREKALSILKEEAGRQFDPSIVETFLGISEAALLGPAGLTLLGW